MSIGMKYPEFGIGEMSIAEESNSGDFLFYKMMWQFWSRVKYKDPVLGSSYYILLDKEDIIYSGVSDVSVEFRKFWLKGSLICRCSEL